MKKLVLLLIISCAGGNVVCFPSMDSNQMLNLVAKIAKPRPLSVYEYEHKIVEVSYARNSHIFGALEKYFGEEIGHLFTLNKNKITNNVDSEFYIKNILGFKPLKHYNGTSIIIGFNSDNKILSVVDINNRIEQKEYEMPYDVDEIVPINGTSQFIVQCNKKLLLFMDYVKTYSDEGGLHCRWFDCEEDLDCIELIPQSNYVIAAGGNRIFIFDLLQAYNTESYYTPIERGTSERVYGIEAVPGTKKFLIHMWHTRTVELFDIESKESYFFDYRGDPGLNLIPFPGTTTFLMCDHSHDHKKVIVLDIQDKTTTRTIEYPDAFCDVTPIPGSTLFLALCRNKIMCSDSTGKEKTRVFECDDQIENMILIPNTHYFLVNSRLNNKIIRFDFTGKDEPYIFDVEGEIKNIALIPGTTLFWVSCYLSNKVKCFDSTKKENPRVFEYWAYHRDIRGNGQIGESERDHYVDNVMLIPDTTLLLVLGYKKKNIMCFDATAKIPTRTFEHAQSVRSVALVSGTTQFIAAAGRSVVLWDSCSGR